MRDTNSIPNQKDSEKPYVNHIYETKYKLFEGKYELVELPNKKYIDKKYIIN